MAVTRQLYVDRMSFDANAPVRQILTASEAWKVLGERRKVRVESKSVEPASQPRMEDSSTEFERLESDPLSSWMGSSTAWKMLGARHLERSRSSESRKRAVATSEPTTPTAMSDNKNLADGFSRTESAPAGPSRRSCSPGKGKTTAADLYLMQELQKLARKQQRQAGNRKSVVETTKEHAEQKMDAISEESAVSSSVEGSAKNLSACPSACPSGGNSARRIVDSQDESPQSGSPGCSGIGRRGRFQRRRRSSTCSKKLVAAEPGELAAHLPPNDPRFGLLFTDAAHVVLAHK